MKEDSERERGSTKHEENRMELDIEKKRNGKQDTRKLNWNNMEEKDDSLTERRSYNLKPKLVK